MLYLLKIFLVLNLENKFFSRKDDFLKFKLKEVSILLELAEVIAEPKKTDALENVKRGMKWIRLIVGQLLSYAF